MDDKRHARLRPRHDPHKVNYTTAAKVHGTPGAPDRSKVFIATKFGFSATPEDPFHLDVSPACMKTAVEASLRRLRIETIDLYYAHRIDPKVPVEEMVGARADLVREGKARYLSLCFLRSCRRYFYTP